MMNDDDDDDDDDGLESFTGQIKACMRIPLPLFDGGEPKWGLIQIFYLMLVGATGAGCVVLVNLTADNASTFQNTMLIVIEEAMGETNSYVYRYLFWIFYTIFWTVLSYIAARFICENATGSGIPDMRAVLAGFFLHRYLSSTMFIARILSLTFALCSGLPVGTQGPFMHITTIIANLYAQHVPLFKRLRHDSSASRFPPLKLQMFVAAVAAGIGNAFGAPLGGGDLRDGDDVNLLPD
eukprot:Lithocolla_globosa_v1_NODE_181_length_5436_cov_36.573128.p2 type:complete len:238 gc:universal NODE_181_length_5436_cov_36.573128:1102-389(-)